MISALPWVQDGVEVEEIQPLDRLGMLALYNHDVFLEVMGQPWMLEGRNKSAIESLGQLANHYPEELARIMSHPTFSDGITDDEAKILAVLYSTVHSEEYLTDGLLDPDKVMLEKRTAVTVQGEEVPITIVRLVPGSERTVDIIEQVVRLHANFMGLPWPSEDVIQLFAGDVVGANGRHYGANIRSDADIDDGHRTLARDFDHLAHENGHYFWTNGESWITESGADVLAAAAKQARFGWPMEPEEEPCRYANSISDPESSKCPYHLGQRFFLDLYHQLDSTTFRTAFRRLFLLSQYDDNSDNCPGTYLTVCHVEAAFKHDATPDVMDIVDEVLGRWYYGTVPHDSRKQSLEDTSPVNPVVSGKNITINSASIITSRTRTPVYQVSLSDSSRPRLYLEFSYEQRSDVDDLTIEIVLYYKGDGFTFARQHNSFTGIPTNRNNYVLGDPSSWRGKPGDYLVYAYLEGQKVAEVSYEIVP